MAILQVVVLIKRYFYNASTTFSCFTTFFRRIISLLSDVLLNFEGVCPQTRYAFLPRLPISLIQMHTFALLVQHSTTATALLMPLFQSLLQLPNLPEPGDNLPEPGDNLPQPGVNPPPQPGENFPESGVNLPAVCRLPLAVLGKPPGNPETTSQQSGAVALLWFGAPPR